MILSSPGITAYVLVVAALVGLVMGSFINCWAWRYMNGESVVKGRSHCTSCGHDLGVRDLVPVFSWLSTKGACRYCGQKVSARYPITELVCAIAFVAITARYGLSIETAELLAFAGILLFLSLTDLDDYLIPNGCIIAAIAVRAVYLAVSFAMGTIDGGQIAYYLASGFGVGIALLVIVLVADKVFGRDSMGGGDLKLYFVAALYFGWQQSIFLVIVSCILGIAVALLAPARPAQDSDQPGPRDEKTRTQDPEQSETGEDPAPEQPSALKRMIPFGPSIAAACIITMLAGDPLLTWYLTLLA